LNRSTGARVGIYPEVKHPQWHRRHGIDLAQLLLAELRAFGYSRAADPVFVQCFDSAELVRIKSDLQSELRLIQLVGPEADYAGLLTTEGLRRVAGYAHGLGPHYSQLADARAGGPAITPLAQLATDAGLCLHPYTFRREELPAYARTLEELLEFFFTEVRVAGAFCDHPDVAVRVRNSLLKVQ
jgi:glycerophosphoryl diester phosphodiesterase